MKQNKKAIAVGFLFSRWNKQDQQMGVTLLREMEQTSLVMLLGECST